VILHTTVPWPRRSVYSLSAPATMMRLDETAYNVIRCVLFPKVPSRPTSRILERVVSDANAGVQDVYVHVLSATV
jgi:hypothetical protein